MSWDVLVMNYHGSPPADMDEMSEETEPDPLGKPTQVRKAISKHLPDVNWSDPNWGIYEGDGFTIEFSMGKGDPVETIMLHVRGGGEAIATLLHFAKPNKWSLFDCSTSEFLDPENPSAEGWEGFQEFRDKVVKKKSATKKKTAAKKQQTVPKKTTEVKKKSAAKKKAAIKKSKKRS